MTPSGKGGQRSSSEAAGWAGAVATFLAVLVALFKEEIQALWRRPSLAASIRLSTPDCHKTEMTVTNTLTGQVLDSWPCYYFRVWVENSGNLRAEQVQMFLSRLLRKHADGSFKEEKQFLPMNLRWANSHEIFAEGISPKMGKHCDLGHIVHPSKATQAGNTLPNVPADKVIMSLDLEVKPNTKSHLLAPGTYRLELRLAAANSTPVVLILELTLTGGWYDDESRMFADGIGISHVS